MTRRNFGRNLTLTPEATYTPRNESDVLEILRNHPEQSIRCCGRLHSWSRAIEAEDVLIDMRYFESVEPDQTGTLPAAWLGGGCQIKRVLQELQKQCNWTLPSVGFITEQTVAGAISTGTHGSGRHSLSHYALSVRVARYDSVSGEPVIVEIDDGDELRAARCSLGCLGVILSVKMICRETYCVEEHFREYADLASVIEAEQDYSLQQFFLLPWRWTYLVQHRRESPDSPSRFAKVYQWYRYFVFDIAAHLAILLVARLIRAPAIIRLLYRLVIPAIVPRDWRTVADSSSQLVMEHELFRHLEIELFVEADQFADSMTFLKHVLCRFAGEDCDGNQNFSEQIQQLGLQDRLEELAGTYCHHYVICVRKILTDDTLISMACPIATTSEAVHTPHCYSITLTNYSRRSDQQYFLNLCEFLTHSMSRLFLARPHWGKLCPMSPTELTHLYPEFHRFREIADRADTKAAFRNQWTSELLSASKITSNTLNE